MDIKVNKTGDLKSVYSVLGVIFLVVALILFLFEQKEYTNFILGAGLLFLMSLYQMAAYRVLELNDEGITRFRWFGLSKRLIPWSEITLIEIEHNRFNGESWVAFVVTDKYDYKFLNISLKRLDVIPKDLYESLLEHINYFDYDIRLEGLLKWID